MATMYNSDAAAFLKEQYTDKRINLLTYRDHPFFGMMPKDESYGGELLKIPVKYADLKGASSTFTNAQNNINPSGNVAFEINETKREYALFRIDGMLIEQSKTKPMAFFSALDRETESAFNVCARRVGWGLYRSGSGSIGRLASTSDVTTNSQTMANRGECAYIEPGMKLRFDDVDGGGTLHVGTATVISVDRDAGTWTTTNALNTYITGVAASDYVFPDGDYDARFKGFTAWCPESAPGATTFFGVARNVDTVRLGGIRVDATGLNIKEALIKAALRVHEEGGKASHAFVTFADYEELLLLLESAKEFCETPAKGGGGEAIAYISYSGVKLRTARGVIEVYPDIDCPPGMAAVVQMDTWVCHSTGKVPHVLGLDTLEILRLADADEYEGRVGAYLQPSCAAPGWNAHVYNL